MWANEIEEEGLGGLGGGGGQGSGGGETPYFSHVHPCLTG